METRAYKLMRLRKNNTLGSLFINRKEIIFLGKWLRAESYPTKGYAFRPGWHLTFKPIAPHLNTKGRVWVEALVKDYSVYERPLNQGGKWILAKYMKVVGIVDT